MTRRLPAAPPGPAPSAPEGREEPPRAPDLDDLDSLEADDAQDLDLLDPGAFPDDPEDPALTAALAVIHTDLDALPSLDVEGAEEDVAIAIEDDPPEDDLDDLDAPDDLDLPVLSWSTTLRLDGRTLPAVVEPGRQRTVWLTPDCRASVATVQLELAGRRVRLQVDCSAENSEPERVLLGRDVLAGRFLLRP